MVVQIICNSIMFLAYAVNIGYFVYKLVDIDRGLKNLWVEAEKMFPKEEIVVVKNERYTENRNIYRFEQKRFEYKFLKIFWVSLGTTIVTFVTCLFDGVSSEEVFNSFFPYGVFIGAFIFINVVLITIIAMSVKKYKLIKSCRPIGKHSAYWKDDFVWSFFIASAFALSTTLVVYTIRLLCM